MLIIVLLNFKPNPSVYCRRKGTSLPPLLCYGETSRARRFWCANERRAEDCRPYQNSNGNCSSLYSRPDAAARHPYLVLARGRKKVILIINETGAGGFGLSADRSDLERGNFADHRRQAVVAHHRVRHLRRSLRQDWVLVTALIQSAKCGLRSADFPICDLPSSILHPRFSLRHGEFFLHGGLDLRPRQTIHSLRPRRHARRVGRRR